MAAKAASGGKITSANNVQTSHVFSQFQLRVNFMGSVKLAFITPATSKIRKPYRLGPCNLQFLTKIHPCKRQSSFSQTIIALTQAQSLESGSLQLQLLASLFRHNDLVWRRMNISNRAPPGINSR